MGCMENGKSSHSDEMKLIFVLIPLFVCVSAFQTEGKLYLILDFLRGGDVFTRLSKEVS